MTATSKSLVGERILGAVSGQDQLWVWGSGKLASCRLADWAPKLWFETGVMQVTKAPDGLWALLSDRSAVPGGANAPISSGHVWLARFERGWRMTPTVDVAAGEQGFALISTDQGPAVLTNAAIYRFVRASNQWRRIPLSEALGWAGQVSAAVPSPGTAAYVGLNRGEWGGGLRRIDLASGAVESIERRDSAELCGGPLNSECDPVTGVVVAPDRSECVLASVGLVHFFSRGHVLQVCGREVSVVLEDKPPLEEKGTTTFTLSEPFFGLARAGSGVFAVSPRALYRLDASGLQRIALPKLRNVAGLHLTRDVPGVLVLSTDVNWGMSLSGYTPLVVALDK